MRGKRSLLSMTAVLIATVGVAQAQPGEVNELAKLLASDGLRGDFFGASVAIEGDTAVIGANATQDGPGWAYVFERVGCTWSEAAKLAASDGVLTDEFGRPVAISGNTIMVGAVHNDEYRGAVYVFEKPADGWHDMTETCKLVADDTEAGDTFRVVAISGDTAVIGAGGDRDYGSYSGSAYVFERIDGVWTQVAKLWASDAQGWVYFGDFVAIQDDTILISAHACGADSSHPGSAYVFEKPEGGWMDTNDETAMLTPSDGEGCIAFGMPVALSADASVILIGAPGDDNEYGVRAGSAYAFERPANGWVDMTENHKITNAPDGQPDERFGSGLSLNADGDIAGIGAYLHDGDCGTDAGAAYVFRFDGSTWNKEAMLTAFDCAPGDKLGLYFAVALSGDTALIGAFGADNENGVDAGAAYVFDIGDEPASVEIDIKPGSYPNSINLGSHGVIPVAILSSCAFDATHVDAETVLLSGAGVAVRGRGNNLLTHEQDVNEDGLLDLVVQVETENLDPEQFQDGYGILTGTTFGAEAFIGMDEITIVP